MTKHSRRHRNRRIGEFLKELELTEGRGTGIPKIQRAMAKNGSPEANFEFDEDHSYFATILPIHPKAAVREAGTDQDTDQDEKTGDGCAKPSTDQVTEQVGRLVRSLGNGALSAGETARALGLSHLPTLRASYLKPAIALGLVEMLLPDKPTSGRQRYRLTPAGAAWLAKGGG